MSSRAVSKAESNHARTPGHRSKLFIPADSDIRGESAVATIWLVFYVLALGVTITSVLVSGTIEIAAR